MPRILLVFEFGTLNGGERSMLAVLDHLRESGADADWEFVACAPKVGALADELKLREVPHWELNLRDAAGERLPRERLLADLRTILRESGAQLLHANSLSMGRISGALTDAVDVPCVAHLRDILRLSRAAIDDLNRNRALIAVSEATRRFHVQQGMNAQKVRVIRNGVDLNRFRPRSKTGFLVKELGLPPDSVLIATIGQIGLRKGQDVLAMAAPAICRRFPNVHFLLIGERFSTKAESIAYEQGIVERFAIAGLKGHLHRLGYRTDIAQLLNEIDLLVHPAHQEPLGRVLLEAAASGVPIIATDVGGTPEIVTDRTSARLFAVGVPGQLSEAVCELIAQPVLGDRLADAARRRMEAEFSIDRAADRLARLWRELLVD